ncbi:hypothetical protein [Streptomyces tanashiensis]|uniref:Uncharacterized protein n=1 Tax=Streptomyces tanashiensis TaxID=67367 RepID=A0ABY6R878_9ACTN|nr:hypothetical protein [Streptomyces tanashiensis]UZX26273.1 hypothetical protein LDH80_38975 [Streptomyces tanashiensis]
MVAAINEWLWPARGHPSGPHPIDHGVVCRSRLPVELLEFPVVFKVILPGPAKGTEPGTGNVPQLIEKDSRKEMRGL